MSPKELKAIIKVLKASGIISYKDNGVEILFTPEALEKQIRTKSMIDTKSVQSQIDKLAPGFQGYSDEQLLNWSAPDHEAAEQ